MYSERGANECGDCVLMPTETFNYVMTRTNYISAVQESDSYCISYLK